MNTRRAPAGNLGSLPSNASSGKAGAAAEGTHGVALPGCHCCPLRGWHGRAVSLQDPSLPGSTGILQPLLLSSCVIWGLRKAWGCPQGPSCPGVEGDR